MKRVLDHIDGHLDEDLSVERLAQVAAFSKYHFHRQFSELFGISVARYVQLVRMKRASYRLAFRGASVMEVALNSGYEGPEAFARAFKQWLEQTPNDFRKQPNWTPWLQALGPITQARSQAMANDFIDGDVRIVDFSDTPVALLEHRGDPSRIGDSVRRFISWRRSAGLPPRSSATYNIFHSDPASTAAEDYRMDICAATNGSIEPNEVGVVEGLIPGGRCAVLRLTGASDDLGAGFTFLYADWLPRSGEELRDFPPFAQRVKFFPEVPENETVTDLFLPLR